MRKQQGTHCNVTFWSRKTEIVCSYKTNIDNLCSNVEKSFLQCKTCHAITRSCLEKQYFLKRWCRPVYTHNTHPRTHTHTHTHTPNTHTHRHRHTHTHTHTPHTHNHTHTHTHHTHTHTSIHAEHNTTLHTHTTPTQHSVWISFNFILLRLL